MPNVSGMRRVAIAALAWTLAAIAVLAQSATSPAVSRAAIDGPQLLKDLQVLSADDMEGRKVGTDGNARARAYIIERFKAAGIQPIDQSYTRSFPVREGSADATGVNVIGRIEGRQPSRYVVISAHYDHVGVGNGGQIYNGANDNASGTAALFALGHYFSQQRPRHSLLFVAFDAEEEGLLGSRAFVQAPPVERSAMALNINADMVGRDADDILWVTGASRQPFLEPFLARVTSRAPVRLRLGHDTPDRPGDWMPDSDQFSFFKAGIPALYVGVEDSAHHHKPTDDYANMTHRFFVNAVETLRLMVEEFDANLDTIQRR